MKLQGISDLGLAPAFDLTLHWRKVSLDAVHSVSESIDQVEALRVLGQNRGENTRDNVSDSGSLRLSPPHNRDFWTAMPAVRLSHNS